MELKTGALTLTPSEAGLATALTFDDVLLVPQHTTAKSVDVCNGSQNNGTCVQQYNTITGGSGQKFTLKASGSNWAIAMGVNANKCITPTGNSTANGTIIQVQDCNNSSNQAWTVTANATNGGFTFKNVASGSCLDVTGKSTANGSHVSPSALSG